MRWQLKPSYTLQIQKAVCESDLPSHLRHLIMVMAVLANYRTGGGWYSQSAIARALGVDARTVRRRLAELAEKHPDSPVTIQSSPRYSQGGGRSSNQWRLVLREQTGRQRPLWSEEQLSNSGAQPSDPEEQSPGGSVSIPDAGVLFERVGAVTSAGIEDVGVLNKEDVGVRYVSQNGIKADTHGRYGGHEGGGIEDVGVRGSTKGSFVSPSLGQTGLAKDLTGDPERPSHGGKSLQFSEFADAVRQEQVLGDVPRAVLKQALTELGSKRGQSKRTMDAWERSLRGFAKTIEQRGERGKNHTGNEKTRGRSAAATDGSGEAAAAGGGGWRSSSFFES